jgi:two-component system, cell cycle response regulator
MSQPHKIVLVGFSSFEKVTFESFFRLAARRPPGYVLVDDAAQAHLAVVNADDPATLRQCMASKPAAQVLLIGSQDGGTGWMLQRRPLNLMKVLATVEGLLSPAQANVPAAVSAPAVLQANTTAFAPRPMSTATAAFSRGAAASQAAIAPSNATAASGPGSAQGGSSGAKLDDHMRRSVRSGMSKKDFESSRNVDVMSSHAPNTAPQSDSAMSIDHILVVDDSDIALKFMRNRLSRFGFQTDLVSSGEEALGKMNARPYKFVFLDVMMEGLDGYQTCRAIKQRKYADGKPPVVVMLTSRGGTIDKIRGTLAGCDAYLTKPLNERDLIAVLAKHDRNVARGFQETNFGNSVASGFARSVK